MLTPKTTDQETTLTTVATNSEASKPCDGVPAMTTTGTRNDEDTTRYATWHDIRIIHFQNCLSHVVPYHYVINLIKSHECFRINTILSITRRLLLFCLSETLCRR
ncbi:hypothetical protein D915_010737 [Fasciola hepatica]|uniref:Uncharacterized protein n=1 Tax=Fasciola hepatica TaxID=6192 RepID=A0A4E0QYW2_FASHE|nr:hypothetical protein D915_010737 [Fasciola hepatica]